MTKIEHLAHDFRYLASSAAVVSNGHLSAQAVFLLDVRRLEDPIRHCLQLHALPHMPAKDSARKIFTSTCMQLSN